MQVCKYLLIRDTYRVYTERVLGQLTGTNDSGSDPLSSITISTESVEGSDRPVHGSLVQTVLYMAAIVDSGCVRTQAPHTHTSDIGQHYTVCPIQNF